MTLRNVLHQKWILASLDLVEAYTDFILSRQAMRCNPATLSFYGFTVGKFVSWLKTQGIGTPAEAEAQISQICGAQVILDELPDSISRDAFE